MKKATLFVSSSILGRIANKVQKPYSDWLSLGEHKRAFFLLKEWPLALVISIPRQPSIFSDSRFIFALISCCMAFRRWRSCCITGLEYSRA